LLPLPLTYWPPKRQCGGDYWKESIGRMFSVSVTLLIILKILRLDKRYNSPHSVDTNLFLSNLDHPKIKMPSEHLFLSKMNSTWSLSLYSGTWVCVTCLFDTPSPCDTLDESFCMHSRVSANEMRSKPKKIRILMISLN
jgi:hypothetical protein